MPIARLKITIFTGDICDAGAEVLCTSTNPRLTLAMGTGGSVRDRGGYGILRECERIVETAGGSLPPGSVHETSAGDLNAQAVMHCVASDYDHRSSAQIIESCVRESLATADAKGYASIAMPVFAAGHASFGFARSLEAMARAIKNASTRVAQLIIVVYDAGRADEAATILRAALPAATIDITKGPERDDERPGLWSSDWS